MEFGVRAERMGMPPCAVEPLEPRQLLAAVFAITDTNTLLQFDSAAPGVVVRSTPIVGLPVGQVMASIDFKPGAGGAAPTLYGVASGGRTPFYRIDITTGQATQAAPGLAGGFPTSYAVGFDYDDLTDTFRYTDELGGSYRFNTALTDFTNTAGLSGLTDVAFRPTGGDAQLSRMVGVLYNSDEFVEINPATGLVVTRGPLGVDADKWVGLDIAPEGGTLVSLRTGGLSRFGTISTGDGHSFVDLGTIGNGAAIIRGIAVDPTPQSAPVLNASGLPSFDAIDEDGGGGAGTSISSLIASGGAGFVTDPNLGAQLGIALTAADDSHGAWQYTLDGAAWNDVGFVSDESAILLPADGVARLRFVPEHDFNGTLSPAARFRAWDRTGANAGERIAIGPGGGSSGFSTGSAAATLLVRPVADPAVIDRGDAQSILITDKQFALPFAAFVVTHTDDPAGVLTTTVSFDPSRGQMTPESLAASGFVTLPGSEGGVLLYSGTAEQTTAALRLLAYRPLENIAPVGQQTLSILTLTVDDHAASPVQALAPFIAALSVRDGPSITGVESTPFAISDVQTVTVFAGVTISDIDSAAQVLTTNITFDAQIGAFTPESLAASGFVTIGAGLVRFDGTAEQATAASRQLVFRPTANVIPPGSLAEAAFGISVDDGLGPAATAAGPTVVVSSVNDAPTVSGVISLSRIRLGKTVKPFRNMVVSDADAADTISAVIRLDKPAKGAFTSLSLRGSGFVKIGSGRYRFVGPAAATQAALRKLVYKFSPSVSTSPLPQVKFTLTLSDASGAAVSNGQTKVALKL